MSHVLARGPTGAAAAAFLAPLAEAGVAGAGFPLELFSVVAALLPGSVTPNWEAQGVQTVGYKCSDKIATTPRALTKGAVPFAAAARHAVLRGVSFQWVSDFLDESKRRISLAPC